MSVESHAAKPYKIQLINFAVIIQIVQYILSQVCNNGFANTVRPKSWTHVEESRPQNQSKFFQLTDIYSDSDQKKLICFK